MTSPIFSITSLATHYITRFPCEMDCPFRMPFSLAPNRSLPLVIHYPVFSIKQTLAFPPIPMYNQIRACLLALYRHLD